MTPGDLLAAAHLSDSFPAQQRARIPLESASHEWLQIERPPRMDVQNISIFSSCEHCLSSYVTFCTNARACGEPSISSISAKSCGSTHSYVSGQPGSVPATGRHRMSQTDIHRKCRMNPSDSDWVLPTGWERVPLGHRWRIPVLVN